MAGAHRHQPSRHDAHVSESVAASCLDKGKYRCHLIAFGVDGCRRARDGTDGRLSALRGLPGEQGWDRGTRKASRWPRRRAWAASQRGASGAHPDRQVGRCAGRGWPLLVPLSEHSATEAPRPRRGRRSRGGVPGLPTKQLSSPPPSSTSTAARSRNSNHLEEPC